MIEILMATRISNYHLWDGISRQKTLLEETFACGKEVKLNKCAGRAKHTLKAKKALLSLNTWLLPGNTKRHIETKRKMDDPSVSIGMKLVETYALQREEQFKCLENLV